MSKSILALIVASFFALQLRASQPIFNISSLADANQGQTIDIDFHVDHFSQLVAVQFSVNWNPGVLEFQSIKNLNASVTGLNPSSFNVASFIAQGKFTMVWFEPGTNQVTIPDGSLFFTVEFKVVGNACQNSAVSITSDPLETLASEDGINNVNLVANNGQVSVFGEGCTQDIQIVGNSVTGSCGSTVCVSFVVTNFTDVGAMDFSIVYNPAVLQFNKFQNFAPLMAFNEGSTNPVSPGILRVVWTDQNVQNESLPDGTTLFEVCFDVVGGGGQFSQVAFAAGNDPNGLIFNIDGTPHALVLTPAQVTVQCALQGFAFIADTVCTTPDGITCIDVKVHDFDDLVTFEMSMNWDSTKFVFDHLEGFGALPGLDASVFGVPPANTLQGQITALWIDLTLNGFTLPDYTTIFRLCLKAVGPVGTSSPVTFSDVPIAIEVATIDSAINFSLLQGLAQIKTSCDSIQPCSISYTITPTNPACPREPTGAVDLEVTVTNCTDTPTYVWSLGGLTTQDLTGVPAGTYTVTITVGSQVVVANAIVKDPDPIGVTGTKTEPSPPGSCNGSVNITVTGGHPPYTFLWSNGLHTEDLLNLCAGSYTVTVTDSTGCTFIPNAFVLGADISATINNVSCPGGTDGSVCANASFGVAPYTYHWANSASTQCINDLKAGSYCITITDSASSTRDTCFTVTEPQPLITSASITHDVSVTCKGAIDLNVTGGTPPFTYSWSNGATTQDLINLCGGTYCVTITFSGGACSFDTCFTVNSGGINVQLTATQYGNFQTSCSGSCDGQITSGVTGATGTITYHWSSGPTTADLFNVCPGTYSLTVTDGSGQSASSSVTITAPPSLNLTVQSTLPSDISASDGAASAIVSGGVPNYTYTWSRNGAVIGTTAALNNLSSGVYHIVVTDANGCSADSTIELIVGGECYKGITVITPNDDGKNDYLIITCVFDIDNHLFIYNRNGALVYETDNYTNNWNGVDQDSQPLADGGYHWVLELFHQGTPAQIVKGTVNILRTAD